MSAAVQTIWCELLVRTLADAGVALCVVSPGSRSTPLVAALAREDRLAKVTLVDERAAAFYALGAARATNQLVALVCTSGSAAAHYLPAFVEASLAGIPLVAITADRPPELLHCGASQTIPQQNLYGTFVRASYEAGSAVGTELALRGLRRTVVQALTTALGPNPGPVHLNVGLRKPLEPAPPGTDAERTLATYAATLAGPLVLAPPRLAPDLTAVDRAAARIVREPDGLIVAGALPASLEREVLFALAEQSGYPLVAEAGSQLRFGPRPAEVTFVDDFDLRATHHVPRILVEVGAEPVATAWPGFLARCTAAGTERIVISGTTWRDPDSSAATVLLGGVSDTAADLAAAISAETDGSARAPAASWTAASTFEAALARHPTSETAAFAAALAALPDGAALQIGNSLPIRTVDHIPALAGTHPVYTQRGAAGIDGLIASAAGATRAGAPVLLVLGDVSFAHDLGGLLAARAHQAPLAILVLDNGGGQIFAGLPVAKADLGAAFAEHWLTPPAIDPAAIATTLGAHGVTARNPAEVRAAVSEALATRRVTVIHAPVSPTGARDVRRDAMGETS